MVCRESLPLVKNLTAFRKVTENSEEEKKMNIVLFDMDNTLVSADTTRLWAHFLDKKGIMTAEDWQQQLKFHEDYKENRLDVLANFKFELGLLNKIPAGLREKWRHECFQTMIKPLVSSIGLRLIQEYKTQPDTLVLLTTATYQFLAAPVAEYVGVHEMIATKEEMQGDLYTGRVLGIPNIGEGKIRNFQLWVAQKKISVMHTTLYSDSINDFPLLSQVGKPIVVDPDHYLHAIAVQKNWPIISFKNQPSHINPSVKTVSLG